ncbi:MAG: methylated-DNA--[protein]-cysteine S-methyltransferase [Pseudomonadales bacterium]|jgi:methylated-DNA-[protein]-cysteine S-methyltransferase|nr:methylated-DNA--[protein]-cysteine S-methyltransferase [Pseudomonadales bacterium]MDP6471828.1 methylated-DNA--[protein]-cysteine S-methyltransferase [Pseudomonadales bacterium]MDP6828758.1 methylated-DNA--[protein]-cysteine S-methyltransferase [Pseudomonadales bacterium]MDP6970309.1 methylated-DNA--[protein]-cysteine S-methyltransferase [Pseudomonadales bacterium]|tara:strand:+ start:1686 stop:2186 length:501 start_codon:yes stop_codon:yes gene_type:complete
MTENVFYTVMDSPIGLLTLAGSRTALKIVGFSSGTRARGAEAEWERYDEPFRQARKQLTQYFEGQRRSFDLELAPDTTPFQGRVLEALMGIPYGETRSYRDIAVDLGNPGAMRAVGNANGNNPIPIIIPCHRVIASNGSLTGFGGGLDSKRFLLDLERSQSGLFAL